MGAPKNELGINQVINQETEEGDVEPEMGRH
jgi:hypothetical protein